MRDIVTCCQGLFLFIQATFFPDFVFIQDYESFYKARQNSQKMFFSWDFLSEAMKTMIRKEVLIRRGKYFKFDFILASNTENPDLFLKHMKLKRTKFDNITQAFKLHKLAKAGHILPRCLRLYLLYETFNFLQKTSLISIFNAVHLSVGEQKIFRRYFIQDLEKIRNLSYFLINLRKSEKKIKSDKLRKFQYNIRIERQIIKLAEIVFGLSIKDLTELHVIKRTNKFLYFKRYDFCKLEEILKLILEVRSIEKNKIYHLSQSVLHYCLKLSTNTQTIKTLNVLSKPFYGSVNPSLINLIVSCKDKVNHLKLRKTLTKEEGDFLVMFDSLQLSKKVGNDLDQKFHSFILENLDSLKHKKRTRSILTSKRRIKPMCSLSKSPTKTMFVKHQVSDVPQNKLNLTEGKSNLDLLVGFLLKLQNWEIKFVKTQIDNYICV